jgi:localization factor PodJL
MSAGAPWSVKGIDPKAREVAKDLARRSGMTLGEWLNRIILEDDAPEGLAGEPLPAPRIVAGGDVDRVAQALERLADRLEASETRTGLAITGVEHSVRQAVARIDTTEREQLALVTRVESEQGRISERLRLVETAGPRSAEALRALEVAAAQTQGLDPDRLAEAVLQRLSDRIAGAEARTADALQDLVNSFAALDERLRCVESGGTGASEPRFAALAQSLTRQVEAVRFEVAERLHATAGGGDVERRLAQMSAHVEAAERRSRQAVEQLGREMLAVAEAVNRRLTASEERSAEAIDLVGTEIARVAGAVEACLARAEQHQAQVLDRLTGEVDRITERFSDRLTQAEARSADAIRSVGDQVSRLADRLGAGNEPPAPSPKAEPAEASPAGPFSAELFNRAEAEPSPPAAALGFAPEDFEAADGFAPIPEADDDIFAAEVLDEPTGEESRPLSTREVIEQARAAARAAKGKPAAPLEAKVDKRQATGGFFSGFGQARRRPDSALHTALMVAGGAAFLSVGAAGVVLMENPDPGHAAAQAHPFGPAPRVAMALTPGIAPTTVSGAEQVTAYDQAVRAVAAGKPGGLSSLKALADQGYAPAELRLAQLYESGEAGVTPNPAEARRWTAMAAEGGSAQAMHNLGIYYFHGDGGPKDLASAAQWFRKAAELGLVESQYNLAMMYQSGSGVRRDLSQARHWLALAAAQGDEDSRVALAALASADSGPAADEAALTVAQSKRVLRQLGYYDGTLDDRATPEFKGALAAYQRDKGQRPTGTLDPKTAGALSIYQR